MMKMKTVYTDLDTMLRGLDPFGARVFPAPALDIVIEVPLWLCRTISDDTLDTVLKIRTVDDRLIAGVAAAFARRAAAALTARDADGLEGLIDSMDRVKGWTCYHYEDDAWNARVDDPDDVVRECLIMTHLDSLTTFYIYLQGAGDLLYSPHRKGV